MKALSQGPWHDRVVRPVRWIGGSKDDLSAFPDDVKVRVRGALWDAQVGLKSPSAKPLKGFGAGVLEVIADFDGNTFRTLCTVRFADLVYVLHAFQKKSHRGIATPKAELHLIRARLARAKEDYEEWLESRGSP